jgi:hypothetical protein
LEEPLKPPLVITYESRQTLTHDAPFNTYDWQYRAVCGKVAGEWRDTESEALWNLVRVHGGNLE